MSFYDQKMTTNTPSNFYYQQYHPTQTNFLPPLPITTDSTDLNKLDKDLIYKYDL